MNLPPFKKQILLLESGSTYPNDPTPLARVGARWRAFAADIAGFFEKYGVEPPTLNYEIGKPHIQVVRGDLTARLRRDWFRKDTDAKIDNFPGKNRADLYNHSQDAAILAAIPPHTWREKIFRELAVRPCAQRDGAGNIIRDRNGKVLTEMRPRPGVATLELAPDWAGFDARIKEKRIPIVRVLGKVRATWRRQLMVQTFFRYPKDLDPAKFCTRELDPETKRRKTVRSQPGGIVINVPHRDGTTGIRKVWMLPAMQTSALILWHDPKGRKDNLNISLERPEAIRKFVEHPVNPLIEKGSIHLGRIEKGTTLYLPEGEGVIEKKADDKKKTIRQKVSLPEGFYRVKELNRNGIIVVHENALPYELAEKIGIPKGEQIKPPERSLGKRELKALFAKKGSKCPV